MRSTLALFNFWDRSFEAANFWVTNERWKVAVKMKSQISSELRLHLCIISTHKYYWKAESRNVWFLLGFLSVETVNRDFSHTYWYFLGTTNSSVRVHNNERIFMKLFTVQNLSAIWGRPSQIPGSRRWKSPWSSYGAHRLARNFAPIRTRYSIVLFVFINDSFTPCVSVNISDCMSCENCYFHRNWMGICFVDI